jgi:hypothetical protein
MLPKSQRKERIQQADKTASDAALAVVAAK